MRSDKWGALFLAPVFLLLGIVAWAGDVKFTVPTDVKEHRLIELVPEGVPNDAAIVWDVYPWDKADVREYDDGRRLVFVGPPGQYQIKMRVIQGRKTSSFTHTLTINGQVKPPPLPDPVDPDPVDPDVPTPPKPVAEKLLVVVVEESKDRKTEHALVLGDTAYWNTLKQKGHSYAHLDVDQVKKLGRRYADEKYIAEAGGLPLVHFMSDKGHRYRTVKLPTTTATIDKIIKELTGK